MKKEILDEIRSLNSRRELEQFREDIEKELNTREEVISICEEAGALRGRSFGFVKESIEALLPNIFSISEGRDLFRRYVSVIREDRNLKNLYNFYENLDLFKEGTDAMGVVNAIREGSAGATRKSSSGSMDKLYGILSEAYIWSGKGSAGYLPDSEREKYYRLAENVFYRKGGAANIAEQYNDVADLKKMAVEHNSRKKASIDEAFRSFKEKFSDGIDGACTGSDLSEQYDRAKEQCLKTLREAKDGFLKGNDYDSSARIELYIESIGRKMFDKDTVNEDITKLRELEKCFS